MDPQYGGRILTGHRASEQQSGLHGSLIPPFCASSRQYPPWPPNAWGGQGDSPRKRTDIYIRPLNFSSILKTPFFFSCEEIPSFPKGQCKPGLFPVGQSFPQDGYGVSTTTAHPKGSGPELGVRLITVPQERVIRELAPN